MSSTFIKCVTIVVLAGLLQACCMPRGPRPRPHRLTLEQPKPVSNEIINVQGQTEALTIAQSMKA